MESACLGKLTGKYRRNQPMPQDARVAQGGSPVLGTHADEERLYDIIDVLDELAAETGKTIAQISLNWLLQRPTVANIIVGARNEVQLKQNLAAIGWNLTIDQVKRLDKASEILPAYPYWHQRQFPMLMQRQNCIRKLWYRGSTSGVSVSRHARRIKAEVRRLYHSLRIFSMSVHKK